MSAAANAGPSFPGIAGEMAERIRIQDWTSSPLGPVASWTPALVHSVSLMLPAQSQIVLFWGPDYAALYNDSYAPTIGDKHPRALGRPARENWAELWDDLGPLLDGVRNTGETFFAKDRPFYIERHGFGETVYFDLSYSAVRESDGAIGGVLCIVNETTERVRADAALRASEEQLRLATEQADVGFWDVDVVNDVLYWPPRVNVMFGMPSEERATLKEFRARIHPDDRLRVVGAILDACDPINRTPYDTEYRIVRRDDGQVRWMAVKGRATFEAGRCTRMLGIVQDVTARKEIEEQARESEMRYRTLFESIDEGFCIIEAIRAADGTIGDFRYIEENPALALRSGIVGVLGRTVREMLLPSEADAWIETLANVLTTGEPLRFERPLDTTGRLLELYVLRVESKTQDQVAVLFQDITERRNAERRLHELNETLERRVMERTLALEKSQNALQQAQKMEAIGNLTGGIAHDFNNLLQGVTGSLDLIRRKPDSVERVRKWAEAGLHAAERGAKLTAQLLAFSRSQKLEMKPLDLTALLEEMRELLMRTLGPSVRVILDLEPVSARVLCDETQLEMSVLNLAINARDAMPLGGDLIITAERRSISDDGDLTAGDYIELAVSDTGMGMPIDVAQRAFDPFFTTKGVGKGTGLGLSQVYGMARQAGGTARIRSATGHGTTVSIFLCVTDGEDARDAARTAADDTAGADTACILVVDDDPGVRQFLADSLESFGYAVLQAVDGKAGLAMLETARPDAMIVDYAMPGMTGAEVAKLAKSRMPDLPILFASGYAETSALSTLTDTALVLRKPFRVSELHIAIRRALQR